MTSPSLPSAFKRVALLALLGAGLAGCGTLSGGDFAAIAERDEGKTARQLGLPPSLWCADAANRWRRHAGLRVVPSRRAIDQARAGRRVSVARRGDLHITSRGRGGHHVDVVLTDHGDGTLTVIGGNVNGAVSRRVVAARGLFIRPQ